MPVKSLLLCAVVLWPQAALAVESSTHVDPVSHVALALVIILIVAKLGGDLAVRVGQPAVLGELIGGVMVGTLPILGFSGLEWLKTDTHIEILASIGVLILLFEVGLESSSDRANRHTLCLYAQPKVVGWRYQPDRAVRAMNTEHIPLLCDPETHGPLSLNGNDLVNPETGQRFLIRDGIPVFIENLIGRNLKYQKQYDRLAAIYDGWGRAYTWFFRKWRLQAHLYRELEHVPKARVLEVAVGTGWNLRDFASDANLFGLDISWGMLHKCARKFERRRRSVELFQGIAESLPFREEVFDTVFSVAAINFFQDQARAVKEMIRVAKAGTKIVIIGGADKILHAWHHNIPLAPKIPAVREYLLDEDMFVRPADLIPPSMRDVEVHELIGGIAYCLCFRKP